MKSHIVQCFLLSFPVATVGIGSSQKELGRDRSRGFIGGRGWDGAVAVLSFAPPAPGVFDGSTIMGLTGCSSRRPGRRPQQHVPGDQLSLSCDLHGVACT